MIIVSYNNNEIEVKLYQIEIYLIQLFEICIERCMDETTFADRNPIKLLRFKFSSTSGTEKLLIQICRNVIWIHDAE